MTTKQAYQERKQADLRELDKKIAGLEAAARSSDPEATRLLETLRNRHRDAQNAYHRIEASGEGWEALMITVDAAFRNVYVALARASDHLD